MTKKVFLDLETNGLLDTVDTIWLAITKDPVTNEVKTFSDHDEKSEPLKDLTPYLDKFDSIIGHNLIAYDLPVLLTLKNWKPKDNVKLVDTMIISQMNNFRREGKHSLANLVLKFHLVVTCLAQISAIACSVLNAC